MTSTDIASFMFALGQVAGGLSRKDIVKWLKERGVSDKDLGTFELALNRIASAAYFEMKASRED